MKTILVLPVVLASVMLSFNSYAQCTANPVLQPNVKLPSVLRGRLIYHSYAKYGDKSSNLFLKDFRNNTLIQLNTLSWNIEDPMNAHFSPNGRYIVFMGKQDLHWNIFIWKIGSALAPINLTRNNESTGGRSEDAKFSSDGKYIVYKANGDIVFGQLDFTDVDRPKISTFWPITDNGYQTEESMPYLSADGKTVFYSQGVSQDSDLYRASFKIKNNQLIISSASLMAGRENSPEFYPVVQSNLLFFVGWKDALAKKDQIYMTRASQWSNPITELSINDCNADNADPMPIDGIGNMIFSSNRNDSFYRLYLGNIYNGKVWSLSKSGVNEAQKHQLGTTYTNVR